jgi:phenylpropionate dioxygenase-like ring-hydroxylating dioxygenase large terminal subunit
MANTAGVAEATQTKNGRKLTDYDSGRQYGRAAGSYDAELAEVGPGTPMGELLRRYWHPFALSGEIGTELPLPIRALGEDLVAFRDAEGRAGLMYPRCMHRGASLVLGKIEAGGLRCPYHGWLFDTEGHLRETPCELDPKSTRLHNVVRQPWYPVVEKYGLAFTYMGPAEKEPLFPHIPLIDKLEGDEIVVPMGGSQPTTMMPLVLNEGDMDMNWLQAYENFMDPLHLSALHSMINGMQFNEYISKNPEPCKFKSFGKADISWLGHWNYEKANVTTQAIFQAVLPNIHCEGPVFTANDKPGFSWVVPVDDHNYRSFTVRVVKRNAPPSFPDLAFMKPEGWGPGHKPYSEWSLENKQRWQTDYLVQKSLGSITLHSEERLTAADKGVGVLRRMLKQQIKVVREGGNPAGSTPGVADTIDIYASTARLNLGTGELIEGYMIKTLADYE